MNKDNNKKNEENLSRLKRNHKIREKENDGRKSGDGDIKCLHFINCPIN